MKLNTKSIFILGMLQVVSLPEISSQEWYDLEGNIERLDFHTPEVGSFLKVVDMPTDLYSGKADISIPIYIVKSGEIELPIKLQYLTNAIKVNQESTWVGLNWNLDVGGVLTGRHPVSSASFNGDIEWTKLYNLSGLTKVHVSQDLGISYSYDGLHPDDGLNAGYSSRYGHNSFTCVYQNEYEPSTSFYGYLLNDGGSGEAARFTAVFNGKSVNFIEDVLDKKFRITDVDKKYKINGYPHPGSITDDSGFIYYFTKSPEITMISSTFHDYNIPGEKQTSYNYSYYLSKIVSPSGDSIVLSYRQYDKIQKLPTVSMLRHIDHPNYPSDEYLWDIGSTATVSPYYLYEIKTNTETIRFNVGAEKRRDLIGSRYLF